MNIFINGGTRGIGIEIVKILSSDYQNIILVTGRSVKILEDLRAGAPSGNIHTFNIDLEHYDRFSNLLVREVSGTIKTIDILINNAGVLATGDFLDFNKSDARRMMETNFWGPAALIRDMKPFMGKGAHIINISSIGGFQGSAKFRGMSFYSASKAALSCLSECLAVEFADAGIRVNCLALGSADTEMFRKAFPGFKASVDPHEMAKYISDFALNGAQYFNGKVIPVALNTP